VETKPGRRREAHAGDDSQPTHGPEISPKEAMKADEEESLNAKTTYEVIRREGQQELERSPSALLWSGLAGGLAMGFSLVGEGLLRAHLPDAPWRPLIAKLGYSLGFLIVILASQQLFTENTLTPIVPYLARRTRTMLGKVARLWGAVLVANVVGTLLFAVVAARTELFDLEVRRAFGAIGLEAFGDYFWTTFIRGVFAGWLIAIMVWMLPAAQGAQVFVIILVTYVVGLGGLAHIIAGSAETAFVVFSGGATWGDYLGRFFVPTLLGNVVGGVTLVAALNHAQVVSGEKRAGG
jgi:formate/nitrite transporter FocA (FNT family)